MDFGMVLPALEFLERRQARVPVMAGDTADTLAARVLVQEHKIYPAVAQWFCEKRLALTPQGVQLDGTLLPPEGFSYT